MVPKLVDTMMEMGLGREIATLAIPYMWSTPAITDRYSTQTMSIVEGLESHYGLPQTGYIGQRLDAILRAEVDPNWRTLDWATIYRRVLSGGGMTLPAVIVPPGGAAMGGFDWVGGNFLADALAKFQQIATDATTPTTTVTESGGNPAEPWCSDTHPAGTCSPIKGVAKPMTADALKDFRLVQSAANRIAAVKKYSPVAVDGRIGPATMTLVNKCLGSSYSSVDQVAANARAIGQELTSLANSAGAPATGPAPVSPNPSVVGADGRLMNPPAGGMLQDILAFAVSPMGLVAAGGLFYYWRRTKTKGKGKAKKGR